RRTARIGTGFRPRGEATPLRRRAWSRGRAVSARARPVYKIDFASIYWPRNKIGFVARAGPARGRRRHVVEGTPFGGVAGALRRRGMLRGLPGLGAALALGAAGCSPLPPAGPSGPRGGAPARIVLGVRSTPEQVGLLQSY